MKKNLKLRGWLLIGFGAACVLIAAIIRKLTGFEFISLLSASVFGGCSSLGVIWISAGKDERTQKRYEVETKDERNKYIRSRAGYTALWSVLALLLVFGVWLHVCVSVAAGFIAYGIILIGILIFSVMDAILRKKM